MDETADLSRRLESVVRLGTIAEIDHAAARVRVKSGGNDSNWLAWLSLRAGETREWNPPTRGEQCLVLSPGGEMAAGIVLVGIFSDAIAAPSESPDEHLRVYPDGARIHYNHATGALSATGIKTAMVKASEQCTVDCPESEFTGNVLVRGTLTYLGGLNNAGTGTGATISGPIDHDGNLTNSGSISSNGVVLDTHRHLDADGGTTGVPL